MHHHNNNNNNNNCITTTTTNLLDLPSDSEPDTIDFEFQLEQPVNILPADQLFSDGKLFSVKSDPPPLINGVCTVPDSFLYSPKAPKCSSSSSSKWKELLGLKKLYQNNINGNGNENGKSAMKSIKHYFLYGASKPSATEYSSVKFPLLNVNVNVTETDNEPEPEPELEPERQVVVTSRHSLSSSSSGHDADELPPQLSLDSEKKNTNTNTKNPRMKLVKTRTMSSDGSTRGGVGVSTESPRMNSSGKIVFHSLERSSSSPSSFNGGPRLKHRGVERSYSSNVRITPVLNVPVCSLRGFPLFSSKSEGSSNSNGNGNGNRGSKNHSDGSSNGNGNGNGNRGSKNQPMNNRSKIDRS
ncbi:uncharacterized protein LOC143612459 [Bidens hawaiensis]|uniref:uncharacterized protein LOC143612459 n=1 Tax=Bidens hawaiensis TaxID=980011 RepID=UPI00404AA100